MYSIIKLTTNLVITAIIILATVFTGCNQSEIDNQFPGDTDSAGGDKITLNIGEVIIPAYNQADATRAAFDNNPKRNDLFNEWVPIKECNVTRSIDAESEMCIMRLCQDTVPSNAGAVTRADNLTTNATIRLIAFHLFDKSFINVGDYIVSGTSITPVGNGLSLSRGGKYTIYGYTFNSTASLGAAPSSYTWNSSTISIPDLNADFMICSTTIDGFSETNNQVSLVFKHLLAKMSLVFAKGDGITSISACSDVTISNGGTSAVWTVGSDAIATSSSASQKFSTTETGTTSAVGLIPYPTDHTVSVTFPSITINGQTKSNMTVNSASEVSIEPGKTYTMTITFSRKPYIQVSESDITLCSGNDKTTLASTIFAPGNLIQPNNAVGAPTFTGSTSDYGHYYCWRSDWLGEGTTDRNGNDPCQSVIGQEGKWNTPSLLLLQTLARCTDKKLVAYSPGFNGMWFMNNPKGLFLPAADLRDNGGSGTTATTLTGQNGYYWQKDQYSTVTQWDLHFTNDKIEMFYQPYTNGLSVRCVQEKK